MIRSVVYTGGRERGTQFLGDHNRNQIDLVTVRYCSDEVGIDCTRTFKHTGACTVIAYRTDVQKFLDPIQPLAVQIDKRNVVFFQGQGLRDVGSCLSRADDDHIHCELRNHA